MAAGDIRAGRAFVEITTRDSALIKGLKRAQARLKAFSTNILSLGARLVALSVGLVAPFVASAKVFSSLGDAVAKMARRTGLAVETVSELAFAASQSGTSIEALEKGIRAMQRGVLDAARGLSTATDNLEDLGIELKDLQGLNAEEQFKLFADRLSEIDDQGKRAALSMKVFGKSGAELLPLFEKGSKGIEEFQKEARKLGIVFSKEDAAAAEVFTDLLDKMQKTFKAITFQIGGAVAPAFGKLAEKITGTIMPLIEFIKANREMFISILKIIGILAGVGTALIAVAVFIKILSVALGVLAIAWTGILGIITLVKGAFLLLATPVGILIAVLAGATAAFLIFTETGKQVVKFFADRFAQLGAITRKALGGVVDALKGGDILLAARILWTSLKLIWFTGTQELQTIFFALKNSLTKIVVNISASIQTLFANMWAGIRNIFQKGKAFINDTLLGAQQIAANIKFKLGIIDEKEFGEITNRLIDQMGEFKDQQKSDLDSIEKTRIQSLAKIAEAQEVGLKGADIIQDKSLEGIRETIRQLTGELGNSTKEAAQLNIETEKNTDEIKEGVEEQDKFQDILDKINVRQQDAGVVQKTAARGAFSAQAARALAVGGAKIQDRILEANKETAANTKKISNKKALQFE